MTFPWLNVTAFSCNLERMRLNSISWKLVLAPPQGTSQLVLDVMPCRCDLQCPVIRNVFGQAEARTFATTGSFSILSEVIADPGLQGCRLEQILPDRARLKVPGAIGFTSARASICRPIYPPAAYFAIAYVNSGTVQMSRHSRRPRRQDRPL